MAAVTLNKVLIAAARLPSKERQILEYLLRKRRIEVWRAETAAEARKSAAAIRSGKDKARSAEAVIVHLHMTGNP